MNISLIRIPKTGSTTLFRNLPVGSPDYPCLSADHIIRAEYEAHGHPHDYITMVRDPLQIYCSNFYFLKNRMNIQKVRPDYKPAPKMVLADHMNPIKAANGIEQYLVTAPTNDFITRYFSGALPDDFVFIGETNHMAESLALLSAITGLPTRYVWENKNPKRPSTLQPYWVPKGVGIAFKKRNEQEYELYAKSVERFNALKAKWL